MLLFFISLFNYLFLNRIYHIHFNIKFNTFTALGVVFKMPSLLLLNGKCHCFSSILMFSLLGYET